MTPPFITCATCETTYRCTDLEHCCGPLKPPPADRAHTWRRQRNDTYRKERIERLRDNYRGLQGTMPPFGDVIFLLRLLDEIEAQSRETLLTLVAALREAHGVIFTQTEGNGGTLRRIENALDAADRAVGGAK
jgi:hypothetical protein